MGDITSSRVPQVKVEFEPLYTIRLKCGLLSSVVKREAVALSSSDRKPSSCVVNLETESNGEASSGSKAKLNGETLTGQEKTNGGARTPVIPTSRTRTFSDLESSKKLPERSQQQSVPLQVFQGRQLGDPLPSKRGDIDNIGKTGGLLVNSLGQPQGACVLVIKKVLKSVIRSHVPLTEGWTAVSTDIRYLVCQKLVEKFKDGHKIDPSWIKSQARNIHNSLRREKVIALGEECLRKVKDR